MAFYLIVLMWINSYGSMGYPPCDGPGTCVEPPRPVKACFVKGEPCE